MYEQVLDGSLCCGQETESYDIVMSVSAGSGYPYTPVDKIISFILIIIITIFFCIFQFKIILAGFKES